MRDSLRKLLAGKLGRVYVSPDMYNIALPLQENTSNGGYGVLPKGSRIHIEEGKKIRAFTYWEKVNDIDSALFRLSSVWEGELHQSFDESMRIKQSEIRTALTRAENLKEKLDEISAEMAAMLELLKSAGED